MYYNHLVSSAELHSYNPFQGHPTYGQMAKWPFGSYLAGKTKTKSALKSVIKWNKYKWYKFGSHTWCYKPHPSMH